MKGASWVESVNSIATSGAKCETSKVPPNMSKDESTHKSEFRLELSSKLACGYASVSAADEGDTACHGNPCCHENEAKECPKTSFVHDENNLEDEEIRGDVLVEFLYAGQIACGAQCLSDLDVQSQVSDEENINFELSKANKIASDELDLPVRLSCEPSSETFRELYTELSNEPDEKRSTAITTEPTEEQLALITIEPTEEQSTVITTEPAEERFTVMSTEPSSERSSGLFSEGSVELHSELPTDEVFVEPPVTSFKNMDRHEKVNETDNVNAHDNDLSVMSQGEDGFVRYDRSDVDIRDIVDTQSYERHEDQLMPTFPLDLQQIPHEEAQDSGRLSEPDKPSRSKPDKSGVEKHVDSDDKSLLIIPFSRDVSVTSLPDTHMPIRYKEIMEASEAACGEKEVENAPREKAIVFASNQKPVEAVLHSVGTYSKLNQKALKTDIVHQIVDKAQLWLGREQAQIAIDLKPDILGRVHLRISQEAGKVVAEIRAESASTKALIESGLSDLKTALSQKGFSFDALTVSWNFSRSSGGAGSGGNSLSWFSEPNGWGHTDEPTQAATLTNAADSEETMYLLDYTV